MGFIKEVYSENRASLVVAFGRGETSATFFNGDSVEEAMKHFHLYLKDNTIYSESEDAIALENLGIKSSEASEMREALNGVLSSISDEQAEEMSILFPSWKIDTNYSVDERIRYNGKMYKVLQAHKSQADWTPDVAVSLFATLLVSVEPDKIEEWVQPDSTNAYMTGDKVSYDGYIYESLIDDNIWSPIEYPAGWLNITE